MMIFYIDESGTNLNDPNNSYFVLGCIGVAASEWEQMDVEVVSLKRRLVSWAVVEDWEIKGRTLRRGEELFSNRGWEERAAIFIEIAGLISELRCQIIVVQVDKRLLPPTVDKDVGLYRLAFWRLLEALDQSLSDNNDQGMLLFDMRSTSIHSNIQDRRLIDAFREWLSTREGRQRFIELPWFGNSEFYSGLQLADFVSYLTDFAHNEMARGKQNTVFIRALELLGPKLHLIKIP